MVRFVTLFLGLVLGAHEVEVMVDDRVARVELVLDGSTAARLEGKPWKARLDFGQELTVKNLVAVAYDSDGNEVDRTAQPINRPRPRAEAQLLLERDAGGGVRAARLEWQSSEHELPEEVLVTLDGEPIAELEPHRYRLPPVDLQDFHFLQADVRFGDGTRTRAALTFGGRYLAETSGELTALLVSLTGRNRSPSPEAMAGWFLLGEAPLEVVAVEKGPAEVLFVRSDGVADAIANLPGVPFTGSGRVPLGMHATGGASTGAASLADRLRTTLSLAKSHRLRLLEPRAATRSRGRLTFETFLVSPVLTSTGGVYWALGRTFPPLDTSPEWRVADAVAVAGLQAALGSHRRAVVLVATAGAADLSELRPAVVPGYLRALQAPLHVWQVGEGREKLSGWPVTARIEAFNDLKKAVRSLEKELDRQRVVWLDGRHDPQAVRLAEGLEAVRAGGAF